MHSSTCTTIYGHMTGDINRVTTYITDTILGRVHSCDLYIMPRTYHALGLARRTRMELSLYISVKYIFTSVSMLSLVWYLKPVLAS